MLLFYIRHGNPTYKPDELTPLGERQAESVGRRLSVYGVDEVYASSSTRAQQTAKPTCEILKKELHILDWMHESYSFSEQTVPYKDGKKSWVWSHPEYAELLCSREVREMGDKWYEHPKLSELDLGKSLRRMGDEADRWLASFGYEHDREKGLYKITSDKYRDKRIALFAHEGSGKTFLSEILDIPYPYFTAHMDIQQSGLTVIKFDDGGDRHDYKGYARARVLTLSNDAHLFRDGLPTEHSATYMQVKY